MHLFTLRLFVIVLLGIPLMLRAAAGRLAPRAALAPIVFLVTRWPVLVAWGIGSAGMAAWMLPLAIARGNDSLSQIATLAGISVLCGLGFAFLAVGPVFMLLRVRAAVPTLPLEEGEVIDRELLANHFLHGEARGGTLVETDRRLAFKPHRFNVQLDTWSAPFSDIRSVTSEGGRFLIVETAAGDSEWIVVNDAPKRVQELSSRIASRPPCAP